MDYYNLYNGDYSYMMDMTPGFDYIFSLDALRWSLKECRKGVTWKSPTIYFSEFSEYELRDLRDEIYSGQLQLHKLYHTSIYERGKERLICSLNFRDRIIQKSLNQNYLLPLFTPKFIYDNCASLKGKGVDFALNRLHAHLEKAYAKYGKDFYIGKLDLKSYFDSIPHAYIYNIIDRYTEDKRIMSIVESILKQYQYDEWICDGLPIPIGVGLGGEVAQSFGIICLNEADHLLKEQFKIEFMVRYMDDIIIIDKSKQKIEETINWLSLYLAKIGGMRFNEKKTMILPASEGVVFLKFHFYLGNNYREVYMRPDKKSIKREKRKLVKMHDLFVEGYIESPFDILQSYYSYRGHIQRANCFEEINILDQLCEYLLDYDEIERVIIDRAITAVQTGEPFSISHNKPIRNNINFNKDRESKSDK